MRLGEGGDATRISEDQDHRPSPAGRGDPRAVEQAGVGEYDGDEYGGGECILFFCGPDEEALLGVLRPILQRSPLARGAHFVRLVEKEDGEMRRENLRI